MSLPLLIKGTIGDHRMRYTSLPDSKCRREVGEWQPMVDPYANRRAEVRNERTFEGVGQGLASVGAAGVAGGRAAGHVRRFLGDVVRDLAAMIRDLGVIESAEWLGSLTGRCRNIIWYHARCPGHDRHFGELCGST